MVFPLPTMLVASPALISRFTTILVVNAVLGCVADIEPWDCHKDDATCSVHDAMPSTGKTLLQRIASSSPGSPSAPQKKKVPQGSPDKKRKAPPSPANKKKAQQAENKKIVKEAHNIQSQAMRQMLQNEDDSKTSALLNDGDHIGQAQKNEADDDHEGDHEEQTALQRAKQMLDEDMDDAKHMNQMLLYSKIVTIRDAQRKEKRSMQAEKEEEQRQLDMMMEIERTKALKMYEEREKMRLADQRRGASSIIQQMRDRQAQRSGEASHDQDAARRCFSEELPPGAKEFFEAKLCKGFSASEGSKKKKAKSLVANSAATRSAATPNFIDVQNDEPSEMKRAKTARGELGFDGDDHYANASDSQEQVTQEEDSQEEDEFQSSRMSYHAPNHGHYLDPEALNEDDDFIENTFLEEDDAFDERSSALWTLPSKTPSPEPLLPWILSQQPSERSDEVAAPDDVSKPNLGLADVDDGVDESPLNAVGFKKVRALHSIPKMKSFVGRMAEACNMKVIDEGGLTGTATFLTDFKGDLSLDNIKEALFKALMAASKDHWASVNVKNKDHVTGNTAPLDVIGFVKVRALRKAEETITFVTRMIDHLGVKITDQASFDKLMQSYSSPDDSLSFLSLMKEIKKATKQHTWAELK